MKQIDILGWDPGYKYIKESYKDKESGKIVNRKYSSIAAKASPDATDMPLFEGERYYLDKFALVRDSSEIIDLTDYMHLEKMAPLFLHKTIQDNQIDVNALKYIVTGLSFAQISAITSFKKRLEKFKVNNVQYNFKGKIRALPQGVGAKYAIEYYFKDSVPDTYLVIDLGFNTIDTVDVINNTVRPENVKGFKDEGIIKIARKLQDYLEKEFKERFALKEVAEILENKKFFYEGEEHDLSNIIEELKLEYTEKTISSLKERFSREFKRYRKIYFVGGGAYFINPEINKVIEVVPNPEFYNSIGNLLKGEMILKENL